MLSGVQRVLMAALLHNDSVAELRRLTAAAADLSNEERDWLEQFDADGLRMTAMMVQKVRFERLTRGDPEAAAWFERDPDGFMEVYQSYVGEVGSSACFPEQEAELFCQWRQKKWPLAPATAQAAQ